jgi:predicted DNA-binding antitoxin AbrB/MazE fold protein
MTRTQIDTLPCDPPSAPLANQTISRYFLFMTTTVEAIYEQGKLLLAQPLSLPEKSHVRVTIESGDPEREAWLKLSEESPLKTWGNMGDDVFNELLSK